MSSKVVGLLCSIPLYAWEALLRVADGFHAAGLPVRIKTAKEVSKVLNLGGVNHCQDSLAGETSCFEDQGEIRRCDWLWKPHKLENETALLRKCEFSSQSQRRVSP